MGQWQDSNGTNHDNWEPSTCWLKDLFKKIKKQALGSRRDFASNKKKDIGHPSLVSVHGTSHPTPTLKHNTLKYTVKGMDEWKKEKEEGRLYTTYKRVFMYEGSLIYLNLFRHGRPCKYLKMRIQIYYRTPLSQTKRFKIFAIWHRPLIMFHSGSLELTEDSTVSFR